MQIIIDGRPLQTYSAFRGIGRYVRNIAQTFDRDERAAFLYFRGNDALPDSNQKIFSALPRRMITLTDSTSLPVIFSRHQPICYHSTAYALPQKARNVRYLLTVFDLTPLKFPQFFSRRHRLVFKMIIKSALRADTVLAISAKTAADLQEFIPIDKTRIEIIHCMLDNRITPAFAEKPPGPLPGEYLLYTGGADRVKNLETLLQAISRLQVPLLIAGKISEARAAQLLAALPALDRRLVTFTGYVPDSQLVWLYKNAAAFVFPSLNEGFVYPPLESLQCGTAAIVSRAGSLPEILGNAAVFVDQPLAVDEWVEKIRRLLEDAEMQRTLIASGQRLLRKYAPAEFKKNLERIYFQDK
ncbi:MAG: glycosyltransferase family 4 protein [Candidatus Aminicenantes bacterium]|nr:glycosyltransferase family 4 protein [Candidatus Aminicenantes bacterium]